MQMENNFEDAAQNVQAVLINVKVQRFAHLPRDFNTPLGCIRVKKKCMHVMKPKSNRRKRVCSSKDTLEVIDCG